MDERVEESLGVENVEVIDRDSEGTSVDTVEMEDGAGLGLWMEMRSSAVAF